MSTIELAAGREEAERLVGTALLRTEGVQGYRLDGDTFVVQFNGRRSFGQRLAVRFEAAEGGGTTLVVTANRTSPFAFTANPWRRKADFLEELRRIREDPDERARIERGDADLAADGHGVEDGEVWPADADTGDVGQVDPTELRTLNAIKILLTVVLVVLGLVLVAAWLL